MDNAQTPNPVAEAAARKWVDSLGYDALTADLESFLAGFESGCASQGWVTEPTLPVANKPLVIVEYTRSGPRISTEDCYLDDSPDDYGFVINGDEGTGAPLVWMYLDDFIAMLHLPAPPTNPPDPSPDTPAQG